MVKKERSDVQVSLKKGFVIMLGKMYKIFFGVQECMEERSGGECGIINTH